MLGFTEVLVFLVIALLIAQFMKLQRAASSLPPGPTPLPLLGNLWTLNFTLHHQTLAQLAQKYGSIITVWTGHSPLIVVHGYDAVKDALVNHSEETWGRPLSPSIIAYAKERGVSLSNGETWKRQRRFTLSALHRLGVGNRSLDVWILEETKHMVEAFMATEGRPTDPYPVMLTAVANVISSVVFGHRFDTNDNDLQKLMQATGYVSHFLGSHWGQLYNVFPWLMRHLPGFCKTTFENFDYLNNYVKQEIKAHQDTAGGEPQDLIDLYLDQISKTKDQPTAGFDEDNLVQVVIDFFIAGSETVACTLQWALLYMVSQPDVQVSVQQEMDTVLDASKMIQYEDRKKLPYTSAVVHEIQRHGTVIPLGAPRSCVKDTIIQGYRIKQGTTLLANITSALYDPKYWKSPELFTPAHFLDGDRNFVKNEAFVPFSAGQRMCAGDQMAKKELFIFISNLLREFTFQLPEEATKVNFDCIYGISLRPHPYQICAVARKKSADLIN